MATEVIVQAHDNSNQQLAVPGDATNNALRVNIVAGTAVVTPGGTQTVLNVKSTTVSAPAQSTIGTVAGTALASNANRLAFFVQNTGTVVLKFTYGATNPTQTVYHYSLLAGSAADDANGWSAYDDIWRGQVNVIAAATGGQYVIAELT